MAYNPRHQWNMTTYYGASLASLENLGRTLGYSLVGTDSKGVNAFFVRSDLLPGVPLRVLDARRAYHAAGYFGASNYIGHVPGEGPFVEV